MATVAFDTLKFVEKLEAGGFSHAQAKAAAEAFADATGEQHVTRSRLHEELSPMKAGLMLLNRMVGFNLAATISILFLQLKH